MKFCIWLFLDVVEQLIVVVVNFHGSHSESIHAFGFDLDL